MIIELNATILSPARRPIPVQSDCDISEVENIDFAFYKPSVKKFAEGRGKAFLTDLRLVIVADNPTDVFKTLSIPLTSLSRIEREEPRLRNANVARIVLDDIRPTPSSGLGEYPLKLELRGTKADKQAFQIFGAHLLKAHERAVAKSRAYLEDEIDLPAYGAGPSSSSSTTYITADVPSDAPPGYEP
ncbi:hypothetical protein L226DRAFT_565592 [Lentinus tigrinus ALCF2SS1-7]|uniref:Uncharacterized protein n=1 Tax=Lentinus tigrinus ALCF2SS1-6 TaxID=1328759 RepID=A0A5C2SUL1_9APHY|nr:hypothetical protein L227DRAFT_4779 [Lentinus tigrinus ALCF2SS1-6]RPD80751.1 hypothetical protein L226DRAFT_565592 [Lentinus tigrinus ALCF2SS1-7]